MQMLCGIMVCELSSCDERQQSDQNEMMSRDDCRVHDEMTGCHENSHTICECTLERFEQEHFANRVWDRMLIDISKVPSDGQFLDVAEPKMMAAESRMGLTPGLGFSTCHDSCWETERSSGHRALVEVLAQRDHRSAKPPWKCNPWT